MEIYGISGKGKSIMTVAVFAILCGWMAAGAAPRRGSGTAEDPYLISDDRDMQAIGADSSNWDKHFLLTADISLADYTTTAFNIIGTSISEPFTGVFDGSGHTISNFTYTCAGTDDIGLFGYVHGPSAVVRDVGLIEPNIDAGTGNYVGSLVGRLFWGTISGCFVQGGSVSGGRYVGGLMGGPQESSMAVSRKITNCRASCRVSGEGCVGGLAGAHSSYDLAECYSSGHVSGTAAVGGLVGYNSYGRILDCYCTGFVEGTTRVGGLVGYDEGSSELAGCRSFGIVLGDYEVGGLVGSSSGTILNCYAAGGVSGRGTVGGLAGYIHGATVMYCYVTGDVTGTVWDIGGLVGENFTGTISNCYCRGNVTGAVGTFRVGGLVGLNTWEAGLQPTVISKCYSSGKVTGANDVGGLVGYNDSGVIRDSFWDAKGSGQSTSAGGTGKTTAEMKNKTTFTKAGWDFMEIWDVVENQTYPFLREYRAGDVNRDGRVDILDFAIFAHNWLKGD